MWSPSLSLRTEADESVHQGGFSLLKTATSCGQYGGATRDEDDAFTSFDDRGRRDSGYDDGLRDGGYTSNVGQSATIEQAETRDGPYPHVPFMSPSAVMANTEERDFDDRPTELFEAIHGRNWKKAAIWLKNEPEQAAIWIYRLEDDDEVTRGENGALHMRWRTLPLHAAVIFRAPLKLINSLISANPHATLHRDDRGMLPVHLALKTGAPKGTVRALFDAYPEAVDETDDEGLLPLDLAKQSESPYRKAYLNAWASTFYTLHNEADFDTNPTALYTYLHKREWDAKPIQISAADASTWISRREPATKAGSGELRWRMLPLHAALLFQAPDDVIQKIMRAYPAAAQCADDRGMLPLHIALAKRSSEPLIHSLLRVHPESMNTPDAHGTLPIDIARVSKSELREAYIDALERPIAFYTMNDECDFDTNPTSLYLAIEDGNWDIVEHLAYNSPNEVRTWVSKRENKKNDKAKDDADKALSGGGDKIKWRMLPLHAALLFSAPTQTIHSLSQAYPDACSCKCSPENMLPIHIAIKSGLSVEIVEILLMYYSDCLIDTDCKGRTVFTLAEASTNGLKDGYMGALDRGPMYWKRLRGAQEQGGYESVGEEDYGVPPSSALPNTNMGRESPHGEQGGDWQEGEQQLLAPIEMNRAQSNVRAARATDGEGNQHPPALRVTQVATGGASAAAALAAANYIHQQQMQQQDQNQDRAMSDYYNTDPQHGSHGGDGSDEAAFPGKQGEGISQVISRSLNNLSPKKKRGDSKFIGRELIAVPPHQTQGHGHPITASMIKTRPSSPPPQLGSGAAHDDAVAKKTNPVKRLGKKVGKAIARASSRQKGRQDDRDNLMIKSAPTYSEQRRISSNPMTPVGHSPNEATAPKENMAFPEQPFAGLNSAGVMSSQGGAVVGDAAVAGNLEPSQFHQQEANQQAQQEAQQLNRQYQDNQVGAGTNGRMAQAPRKNGVIAPSSINVGRPDEIQHVVSDLTDPYKPKVAPKPILRPQKLGLGGGNVAPSTEADNGNEVSPLPPNGTHDTNPSEVHPVPLNGTHDTNPSDAGEPKQLVSPGSMLAQQEEREELNLAPTPTHRIVMKSGIKSSKGYNGNAAAQAGTAVAVAGVAAGMNTKTRLPTSRSATPSRTTENDGVMPGAAARGRGATTAAGSSKQRSSSVLRTGLKNKKKVAKKNQRHVPAEVSVTSDQETTNIRGNGKYSSMMTGNDLHNASTITGSPSRDTLRDVQHTMELLGENGVDNSELISRIGQSGGRQAAAVNAAADQENSLRKGRSTESLESTITESTTTGQRKGGMLVEQALDEVVDTIGEAVFDNKLMHGIASMFAGKTKANKKLQETNDDGTDGPDSQSIVRADSSYASSFHLNEIGPQR